MSGLNIRAPPPYKHLTRPPGQQISPAAALAHIQTYLEQTRTAAHLHPDAGFSEAGITFTSAAATGGIALHQLRRVEKGLQGVWLGRDVELEWMGDGDGGPDAAEAAPLDYQAQLRGLGESIVEGEVGERNNAVRDGGSETVVRASRKRGFEEMQDGATPVVDKEARKRAKAERKKKEKKERHKDREAKAREQQQRRTVDDLSDEDLIINGTVHDETRDEHDDAAPSSAYLPDKISSTVTKTPDEVRASLANGSARHGHRRRSQSAGSGEDQQEPDDTTDALQTTTSQNNSVEFSPEKSKKKRAKDNSKQKPTQSQTPPTPSASPSQSKPLLTNGDTTASKSRRRKSAKSPESQQDEDPAQKHTPHVLVPSSYDVASAAATPARNAAAVVKETPPSKANGDAVVNGHLARLDESSGEEARAGGNRKEEDADARAQRKAEKRQRKEEKRARKEAKEKRRESKKEKRDVSAESL